jgi:hypothetical protein
MIFRSGDQQAMAQVDGALNTPTFKNNLSRYKVQGSNWSTYARSIMDRSDTETTEFLRRLKANADDASRIPDEEITAFVQHSLPHGSEKEHEQMEAMIRNGDFPSFISVLQTLKSEDARQVAFNYIDQGAARFGMAARAEANM